MRLRRCSRLITLGIFLISGLGIYSSFSYVSQRWQKASDQDDVLANSQPDSPSNQNTPKRERAPEEVSVTNTTHDSRRKVSLSCLYPKHDPWDKKISNFFKVLEPLDCDKKAQKSWVEVIDGKFVITKAASDEFGEIACEYVPFVRIDDYKIDDKQKPQPIANNTLLPQDFFRVECKNKSGHTYKNIHAGIHRDEKLLNKKSAVKSGLGLDVMIFAFDSTSRMQFMRRMPKTYAYLKDVLGAIVLKGYNIVGDGTPQALIPFFTGKTELEHPRPLKRLKNGLTANVFPMAWKNFSQYGYVTSWSEDQAAISTFTYRMNGFKQQPTDHYMRTFHMMADKYKGLCLGDKSKMKIVFDWMVDFAKMYKDQPKFGFAFHKALSHDDLNLLQHADDELKSTIEYLHKNSYLENTLLIVMGDHGARFSKMRATVQGKQEERNAFMSLTFPGWFKEKYPDAYANVLTNSERLVTPFDMYPTLLDVLDFKGVGLGDKTRRSISLFKEIPADRTCTDARIEPHWCNCLSWKSLPVTDDKAKAAAEALVKRINKITEWKRDLCMELSLSSINASNIYHPQKEMLAFKKTVDADGFAPGLSDKMQSDSDLMQLTIVTSPNNGQYEATVKYSLDDKTFTISEDDISRLNRYGDDPHCVYQTDDRLRKYCFCKDRLKTRQ